MSAKGIQFEGDWVDSKEIPVINRSGSTTIANGVYALDIKSSQAETVTDGVRGKLAHIVAASTLNNHGVLVITPKAIADNERGVGILKGLCNAAFTSAAVTSGSFVAASAGPRLRLADVTSAGADIACGLAMQGKTSSTAYGTVEILFDGENYKKGVLNYAVS